MAFRTIVVDDSIIFRKAVRDCFNTIPDVEVVDVASDGESAINKILHHKPDLVTLDVEMPGIDGLGVLKAIKEAKLSTNVIMLSSHTSRGAATTTKALALGAFDFILKPSHTTYDLNVAELTKSLTSRVSVLAKIGRRSTIVPPTHSPLARPIASAQMMPEPSQRRRVSDRVDAVVIGISTGGPKALRDLLPTLPQKFSAPILIVQHMPPLFTATLADDLNKCCGLNVVEAEHGMPIRAGEVYIAPGGKQMRMGGFPGCFKIEITNDPAIKSCRPSVDYLFDSAAELVGKRLLAIVMTGMGDDGTDGSRNVRRCGGTVWAQDEASSTVFGMPRRVIESGLADAVFPLNDIGRELCRQVNKSVVSSY